MSKWKTALNKLEEEKKSNIKEGKIRKCDLYRGLANRIIYDEFKKTDKKWEVEYAKNILEEKEKECKKASK